MKQEKTDFIKLNEENLTKLKQFVPIVNRVHGDNHQEFGDVLNEFDKITFKLDNESFELDEEFKNLRKITSDYLVPGDVCESYEAVYVMLEELDKSYNKKES